MKEQERFQKEVRESEDRAKRATEVLKKLPVIDKNDLKNVVLVDGPPKRFKKFSV